MADVTSPGLNALDEHGSHCNVTIPDSVLVVNPFVPPQETFYRLFSLNLSFSYTSLSFVQLSELFPFFYLLFIYYSHLAHIVLY